MTAQTVTHLIIAAALAGSAAAGLKLAPFASAPVMSAFPDKTEAVSSGGALFFLLAPAADRFVGGSAGLKPARAPILRITP